MNRQGAEQGDFMSIPVIPRLIFIFCIVQSLLCADEWNTVYLASFPRSGNHWVRFLVEEATHIATGSVYRDRDFPHLKNMFSWGGYCTDHGYEGLCRYPTQDDPVLIKTHYPFLPRKIDPSPKLAICLIRHPIDAFWSFYTYREEMHNKMRKKRKRKTDGKMNQASLIEFIEGWRKFYEFWESQPGVLFIRYEDLQTDTGLYLSHILQTAGFSFDQMDIERAIAKYPPQGAPLKHTDCYDAESLEKIKTELADILTKYNYNDM